MQADAWNDELDSVALRIEPMRKKINLGLGLGLKKKRYKGMCNASI